MPLVPLATVALLRRRALREGVLGGSWWWRFMAVFLFVVPFARRTFGRNSETVLIEELKPGERMLITPIASIGRRQRRRARLGDAA